MNVATLGATIMTSCEATSLSLKLAFTAIALMVEDVVTANGSVYNVELAVGCRVEVCGN